MPGHFRPEIAGLRALAVIGVLLFHLKIGGFQGGFVGVDVFFVISGYLITRNILSDLQAGRFSLGQFYVRRTRRIFPALIFTVIVTYLAGALWCSPLMFLDLAKESTHALLWISNIQYWRESHQYFAPASDQLALLHCWSLSVEEQFYLIWPGFIILAAKSGRPFAAIAMATATSFLASIVAARSDPPAVFFLMPYRIFEFGCGAMVLAFERKSLERKSRLPGAVAELLSAAGILAVMASAVVFRSDMPHLGVAVVLPCVGSAAVIWATGRTMASRLITNPAMIAVGAISYSLYLSHWPIIFFGRFIFGDKANDPLGISIMLATTFVVATAMYLFVERRFIQPSEFRSANIWRNAAGFWSAILMLAAITHITFLSKGFAWRLPDEELERAHLQDLPAGRDIAAVDGPVGFQLVGDSHAFQYYAGLSPITKRLNERYEILGGPGCPMLYGVTLAGRQREECLTARDHALERLNQTNLPVILAQRWEIYDDDKIELEADPAHDPQPHQTSFVKLRSALEETIAKLTARGRRILIIGDQVKAGCSINRARLLDGPLPHASQPACPPQTKEIAEQAGVPINQMLAGIQAEWPGKVVLMRPVDYFCDVECPSVQDGIWLYFDRTHFSVAGSRYMGARVADLFAKFLKSDGSTTRKYP
jgi:peptidoglycan/LPS O-acetylase OafA/YrhL